MMPPYNREFVIFSYTPEPIVVEIKGNVKITQIEVDSLLSHMGDYFDLTIMNEQYTIFRGPLNRDIKNITVFGGGKAEKYIKFIFKPNYAAPLSNSKWAVFNDHIKVTITGIEEDEGELEFTPYSFDQTFIEDWG